MLTFLEVLECLGIWSTVEPSLPPCSTTSGDHVCFFKGDEVGDGTGNDTNSLTGTCASFFPHLVCTVETSNMLGLEPESLIFGIE